MNTKTVILKKNPSKIYRPHSSNKYNTQYLTDPPYAKINKSSKGKLQDIDLGTDISHLYRKSKEKKLLKEKEIKEKARLKIAEYQNKHKNSRNVKTKKIDSTPKKIDLTPKKIDLTAKKINPRAKKQTNISSKNIINSKKFHHQKKQVTFKKQAKSVTNHRFKKHNVKKNHRLATKSCNKISSNQKIIYIDKYYKPKLMPKSEKKKFKTVNVRTNIDTYKTIDKFLYLDLFYKSIQQNNYYTKFPRFIDKYINSIIAHNFNINYIKI